MAEFHKVKNTPLHKYKNLVTGFTLMEVVVGTLIIAVIFGGLIATFLGVKRYVSRANRRLVTSNLDGQLLNSLYRDVRADTWDAGNLSVASHNTSDAGLPTSVSLDNFNYGSGSVPNTYTVQNVASRQYRQVTVNVTYPVN